MIEGSGSGLVTVLILLTISSKLQIIVKILIVQYPQTNFFADLMACNNLTTTANHVGGPQHCFWQASDSVCTTVLTVTLSKKKKTALCAVFLS